MNGAIPLLALYEFKTGRDSVVGTATRDGPGIKYPLEARFSAPFQTGSGAHPASGSFSRGVKATEAWR